MTYKAQDFIDAIPGTGGVISALADKVGCEWNTAKKYVTEYATVKQAYENECERVADRAESVLIKAINEGSTSDAKWYLSRIRRGKYTTRQELTGPEGAPMKVELVQIGGIDPEKDI